MSFETVHYYRPYVHRGRVEVTRITKRFQVGMQDKAIARFKSKPQTKLAAKEAISPYLESAEAKARVISEAFKSLEEKHGCYISYFVDGDTHGIHEEFLYTSFQMGDYQFSYELD